MPGIASLASAMNRGRLLRGYTIQYNTIQYKGKIWNFVKALHASSVAVSIHHQAVTNVRDNQGVHELGQQLTRDDMSYMCQSDKYAITFSG